MFLKKIYNYLSSKFIKFIFEKKLFISYEKKISHNNIDLKFKIVNYISFYRAKTFSYKEPETLNWIENFEDVSFEEGSGLPGTNTGYWGGNTYPLSEAMSGPNNVRMYGVWSMKNSNTGKTAKVKSYSVLNFNEDGKVIEATEYGSYNSVLETFE